MFVVVVGVNHRTAPLEIRERLSFPEPSIKDPLARLNGYAAVDGCVILSTCNRTEIYVATREPDEGLSAIWEFLSKKSGVDISEIKNYTYTHTLYDSIRHLFRVAAGLDSMILGETQILGQVRAAYRIALEAGFTNRVLNTLFQKAISVGKRARTETGIDRNAVSVSYAAVELAKQLFGELQGRSVLIIGAGKMSELTVRHMVSNGVSGVVVSNRSYERAVDLAGQFNGKAVNFDDLPEYLLDASIVISCTSSAHYVVRLEQVRETMLRRKKETVLMIDLAVPRDIDPEVGKLPGVTLCDIDDLKNVVDQNLGERKKAAIAAERVIEGELEQFMQWSGAQFIIPTITALKQRGEEIKQKELDRALNRLGNLSEHEKKVIGSLANSIVNQLLHTPVAQLKANSLKPEAHLYAEILQNLFNLEVTGQESGRPHSGGLRDNIFLPGIKLDVGN